MEEKALNDLTSIANKYGVTGLLTIRNVAEDQ